MSGRLCSDGMVIRHYVTGTAPSRWVARKRLEVTVCCHPFLDALQHGTDGEAYGSLIRPEDDGWRGGTDLPVLAFCPWCGRPLVETPPPRDEETDGPP